MEHVIKTACGEIKCAIKQKKIKNLRIRVAGDGSVAVSAPSFLSQRRIYAFVDQNAAFILRRQQQIEEQRQRSYPPAYQNGETFCFCGKRIVLRIEPAVRQSATVKEGVLVLGVPPHKSARDVFALWMARAARNVFAQRIEALSQSFGARDVKLSVRRMLTRWGSINIKKRSLSLTVHLARCEVELIDYVITHELCHLKCAQHNQRFYRELERYFPDRRGLDKRLLAYGLVDF